MCLACRLARLTPFQAVTLFALRPGQTCQFPRNHQNRRNYHQFSFSHPKSVYNGVAVGYSFPPTPQVAKKHRASSTRGSLKFKCQSWEGTSTYCRMGTARRGGGVVNVECVSRDVENGRWIAPMFALEFCSRISSSKVVPPSCPSVLFYSHGGEANMPRFRGRSLLVTCAATSATGTDMRRMYNTTKGYKNISTRTKKR